MLSSATPGSSDGPAQYMGKYDHDVMAPVWKEEMASLGFISCPRSDCRMGFLSIKGIDAHVRQCTGPPRLGEYVACPICGVKFKTFVIMERHKSRSHTGDEEPRPRQPQIVLPPSQMPPDPDSGFESQQVKLERLPGLRTYERNRQGDGHLEVDAVGGPTSRFQAAEIFSDTEEPSRGETLEEQHRRILIESRRLSTARRPGRPSKAMTAQYEDLIRHQQQQLNLARRNPILATGPSRVLQMRTADGKIIDFTATATTSTSMTTPVNLYPPSTIDLPRPPTVERIHASSPLLERPLSRQSDFSSVSTHQRQQPLGQDR